MVSEKIKLLGISEKGGEIFDVDLEINGRRERFEISVVDSRGVFGLELPNNLTDILREFSNLETHKLVAEIKDFYKSRQKPSILQAA